MAINYLNTVNLNSNQLENAAIQNLATDPAAGVLGQVYYNTAISELKICTTAGSPTGAVWTIVGSYDYWVLDADGNGATANITNGMTADFVGGLKITTDSTAGGTLNIVHDTQVQTDTTSTAAPGYGGTFTTVDTVTRDSTGHVTGINVKTVTIPASDNTTYDLASAANATAGVDITLTGSDASTDTINIIGTANEIEIAQTATANKLQIGLPADVTISNDLTVSNDAGVDGALTVAGTLTSETSLVSDGDTFINAAFEVAATGASVNMGGNKVENVGAPTNSTDAATKAYVDAATVGGLVYQGGYDANNNTPVLDSRGTQIAVEKGWTYTVTVDGTFYGEVVRVGDVIIAEVDLAAGNGALTDWTTVQNNIDLASATQVGIGNSTASLATGRKGIDVSYANPTTGTATIGLDIQGLTANDATDEPITNYTVPFYNAPDDENYKITIAQLVALASSNNSATGTITAGQLSGTVTHAFGINTIVQTIDSSGNTVYCDISRTATTSVATISAVQATAITILVQKIG